MSPTPRILRRLVAPLIAVTMLAACGGEDPRLAGLSAGISKDSAIAAMGGASPRRTDAYLVGGQFIEAMLFNPARSAPEGSDTLPDRDLTPLVAVNGLLVGWGWAQWDSVAAAHNIQVAPKN